MLLESLERESKGLLRKLVQEAKAGNIQALKTTLAPLLASAQDNPIKWTWATPRESLEDILTEVRAIQDAVATGDLTPDEANRLLKSVEYQRGLMESNATGNRRSEYEREAVWLRIVWSDPKLFQAVQWIVRRSDAIEAKLRAEGKLQEPVQHPLLAAAKKAVTKSPGDGPAPVQ